jgi:hypothetical protein
MKINEVEELIKDAWRQYAGIEKTRDLNLTTVKQRDFNQLADEIIELTGYHIIGKTILGFVKNGCKKISYGLDIISVYVLIKRKLVSKEVCKRTQMITENRNGKINEFIRPDYRKGYWTNEYKKYINSHKNVNLQSEQINQFSEFNDIVHNKEKLIQYLRKRFEKEISITNLSSKEQFLEYLLNIYSNSTEIIYEIHVIKAKIWLNHYKGRQSRINSNSILISALKYSGENFFQKSPLLSLDGT